jgi:hypothetical protein
VRDVRGDELCTFESNARRQLVAAGTEELFTTIAAGLQA